MLASEAGDYRFDSCRAHKIGKSLNERLFEFNAREIISDLI